MCFLAIFLNYALNLLNIRLDITLMAIAPLEASISKYNIFFWIYVKIYAYQKISKRSLRGASYIFQFLCDLSCEVDCTLLQNSYKPAQDLWEVKL